MAAPSVLRAQVLIAALLFSTGGAAIKASSMSDWQIAGLRSTIAALALLLLMPTWRRGFSPRTCWVGLAYAATMLLYVMANKRTTAANSIFLQSTAPLYVMLIGPWLLREKLRRHDLVLTAILGAGMLLFFVGHEPAHATAPDPMTGNILGALAGLTWAMTILGLRWLGRTDSGGGESAGTAVVVGNLLAGAVALPLAFPLTGISVGDWLIAGYLGTFQVGLAYVVLTRAVRSLPAVQISLLLLLEPVLAAIWAWLLHGERPGPWSLAGCLVIFAATLGSALVRPGRGSG